MNENNNGNFWFGFFLGGLLGAFIIYLLGTKEGKKKLEKVIEQAETYGEELEEKVSSVKRKSDNMEEEVISMGGYMKNSVKDKFTSRMDQALSKFEDLQKKGIILTKDAHRKFFRKNGKSLNA